MSERPMSKAELEAYIADEFIPAMRKMLPVITPSTDWQPIETAPRDGTKFLAIEKNFPEVVFICFFGKHTPYIADWKSDDGEIVFPFKWMPLPKPPTA